MVVTVQEQKDTKPLYLSERFASLQPLRFSSDWSASSFNVHLRQVLLGIFGLAVLHGIC